ncbi:MAG: hypothetical protein ACRCZB_05080 [Bacteroidales bacterium]
MKLTKESNIYSSFDYGAMNLYELKKLFIKTFKLHDFIVAKIQECQNTDDSEKRKDIIYEIVKNLIDEQYKGVFVRKLREMTRKSTGTESFDTEILIRESFSIDLAEEGCQKRFQLLSKSLSKPNFEALTRILANKHVQSLLPEGTDFTINYSKPFDEIISSFEKMLKAETKFLENNIGAIISVMHLHKCMLITIDYICKKVLSESFL